MQILDDQKRRNIQAAAERLFASRPYHEVRLDDVAAEAGVGKGTLYTYFENKQDLYRSLLDEGFARLVESLSTQLDSQQQEPLQDLRTIVAGLVDFALEHPHLFEVMRTLPAPPKDSICLAKLRQLYALTERTIRRGVHNGTLHDPHPELTGLFIPALVRSVMLFSQTIPSRRVLICQIMRFIEGGLGKKESCK